ncbi:MAG TPA: hypothetical protein VGC54_03665 [Planctomycetota bacterium]
MSRLIRAAIDRIGNVPAGSAQRNLGREEAREVFAALLEGDGTSEQAAAFFALVRSKGATADELTGAAEAARARILFPAVGDSLIVVATGRLGKRRGPPLGVASAAAAAACGVRVLIQAAPHARGAGLTLGDVWERMVGPMPATADVVDARLSRDGLACWSPTRADPGWARLLNVEESIGLRGMPDVVTKLLAPAGCSLVVAAGHGPVLGTAGGAIRTLGHERGLVVQGVEGSIDPAVCGLTRGLILEHGSTVPLRLIPSDLFLDGPAEPCLGDGDPAASAETSNLQALTGVDGPALRSVLLGAALLLRLAGRTPDLAQASGLAREAIESGAAQRLLNRAKCADEPDGGGR